MRIETQWCVIVNSEKVRYYQWTDIDGGNTHIGGKGDWYLTAYFNDDNFVPLGVFPRPNYVLNTTDHTDGWLKFRECLVHNEPFYSFRGNK